MTGQQRPDGVGWSRKAQDAAERASPVGSHWRRRTCSSARSPISASSRPREAAPRSPANSLRRAGPSLARTRSLFGRACSEVALDVAGSFGRRLGTRAPHNHASQVPRTHAHKPMLGKVRMPLPGSPHPLSERSRAGLSSRFEPRSLPRAVTTGVTRARGEAAGPARLRAELSEISVLCGCAQCCVGKDRMTAINEAAGSSRRGGLLKEW